MINTEFSEQKDIFLGHLNAKLEGNERDVLTNS
jgi:hypothetical protein